MKIKFLGARLPKTVELPLPFISKCEKTGEVVCNPIGEFTEEDGRFLIGLGGLFVSAEEEVKVDEPVTAPDPVLTSTGRKFTEEELKALKSVADSGIDLSKIRKEPQFTPDGDDMPYCQCKCGTQLSWMKHYAAKGIAKYIHGHYGSKIAQI